MSNYLVTLAIGDENDNGSLDHNRLRLPAQPLGFSNGFELSRHSGLPRVETLQFAFNPSAQTIEARVR